jgi:hypothetical protein
LIEPEGSVANTHDAEVTNAQARKTALVVSGVLLLIASWNIYRGRTGIVIIFGVVGVGLLLVGLALPPAARAFHSVWMRLASALGHVNSRVLLTLVYYLAFAPYGFISRLTGRDTLRRRGKAGESYWTRRKQTRQTREQFERLF